MAAPFGVRVHCYQHGITLVQLSMVAERSGSSNDNCQMRILRRRAGYPDFTLPGIAVFSLQSDASARNWQWIDPDVPENGAWDYVLQVRRLDGAGDFSQMLITALHNKR